MNKNETFDITEHLPLCMPKEKLRLRRRGFPDQISIRKPGMLALIGIKAEFRQIAYQPTRGGSNLSGGERLADLAACPLLSLRIELKRWTKEWTSQ